MGPDDGVAPDVELWGEVLGVGQAQVPMAPGGASTGAEALGTAATPHGVRILDTMSFFEESCQFTSLFGAQPLGGAFAIGATGGSPHIGEAELVISDVDVGFAEAEGGHEGHALQVHQLG